MYWVCSSYEGSSSEQTSQLRMWLSGVDAHPPASCNVLVSAMMDVLVLNHENCSCDAKMPSQMFVAPQIAVHC